MSMSPKAHLFRYMRGWAAGAGIKSIEADDDNDDFNRGWRDGRAAHRAATEAERVRLGAPPLLIVRPAGNGTGGNEG